ncbi:MAG: RNA ligase (ATP), partial [Verrucomicrobia bacterium]|nr:RNA ligase (ATP) [Cytophagales bacterium]
TEKLDGSSVTYFVKDGEFGVCSRNLELLESAENSLWKVAKDLKIEEKLKSLYGNFAIQGEIIGEGIQGNLYKLRGQSVHFFNVFDIDKYTFLGFIPFQETMKKLGLQTVPIVETDFLLSNEIQALVEKSKAKSVLNPNVWREGIVIRTLIEKQDTELGRVSFKAINPEFLLKYE